MKHSKLFLLASLLTFSCLTSYAAAPENVQQPANTDAYVKSQKRTLNNLDVTVGLVLTAGDDLVGVMFEMKNLSASETIHFRRLETGAPISVYLRDPDQNRPLSTLKHKHVFVKDELPPGASRRFFLATKDIISKSNVPVPQKVTLSVSPEIILPEEFLNQYRGFDRGIDISIKTVIFVNVQLNPAKMDLDQESFTPPET